MNEKWVLKGNNFNQCLTIDSPKGVCRTLIGSGHAGNEPKVLIIKRKDGGVLWKKK